MKNVVTLPAAIRPIPEFYMRLLLFILALSVTPGLNSHEDHKFYVSITKVEYVEEQQSLQLITKIFIDDIEAALRERYGEDIHLASNKETEATTQLIERYVMQKMAVSVDGKELQLNYLGREYEVDVVKCYMEVENLSSMDRIEITNEVLFDMFEDQQNIIHVKMEKERKSVVLDKDHPSGVLNFN